METQRATEAAAVPIGQASSEAASPPVSEPTVTAKHLVDVDAVLFRAANECRSFEEVRYYLNGVYVQPHPEKGVLMVGTDGHRMMVVHDETGICETPVIIGIESKALKTIKPPAKLNEPRARLVVAEDRHVIVGTYRSLKRSLIDGAYPDYVLVLKPVLEALRKQQFKAAAFKPEYLADFCKISDIFKSGHHAMRVVTTSESDAALVLFAAAPEAFGILMPMRASLTDGFPAWMRPVFEPPPPPPPAPLKAKRKAKKPAKAKPAKRTKANKRKARR